MIKDKSEQISNEPSFFSNTPEEKEMKNRRQKNDTGSVWDEWKLLDKKAMDFFGEDELVSETFESKRVILYFHILYFCQS